MKKKTKQTIAKSPTYSKKEIKEFLEECGVKPMFTQEDFSLVLNKKADELSYKDIRILFDKAGQLSDEERHKFKYVLIFENLTEREIEKYTRIYPSSDKFNKYFPKKENVEEHYKIHFLSFK